MGVAIACGLGASYMTSRLLAERNTDDEPRVDVLVAKKALNMGDTIKSPEDLFHVKRFIKGEEPPGSVTDYEALRNRILKKPLRVGDHVTQEDLFGDKDSIDVLAALLAPGHRAVGVRVSAESSAYGFATLPLSRVDVISTVRRADDKSTYSQVLLENILVLAADDKTRRSDDGKPMPSQVVTLALKPSDMLKVRLAGEIGTLSLALRKINDVSHAEKTIVNVSELKTGFLDTGDEIVETAKVEPKPVSPPPAPPAPPVVASNEPKAELKIGAGAPKLEAKKDIVEEPVAEVLTKITVRITEGSKTRFVDYYRNEAGDFVDPPHGAAAATSHAEPAHPPRPQAQPQVQPEQQPQQQQSPDQDVTEPNKK
jgi:pilus assembly protein CpaB